MPTQVVLAWTVDVTDSYLSPAQASAKLQAVPLYIDPVTDPVLGQTLGLTVASDVPSTLGSTATRTLTLNMDPTNSPPAPPPFPCHPRTSTPPVLPYPLRKAVTLPGSFFVQNGSLVVATSQTQKPSLSIGDSIQFLSQEGVFYLVASVTSTSIGLNPLTPYTGKTSNTGAFKEVVAPVTIAAVYSSSDLDTSGVATVPAIPAGPGAREVTLVYMDSTGAGPFTTEVTLTGRRPAAVVLAGGIDIAVIVSLSVEPGFPDGVGGFGNNLGQLTLVELSSALPAIPANATPDEFFDELTDEAQLLIDDALAYLPPSYFALAGPGAATPQLAGDFVVNTGSTSVVTTVDQTVGPALSPGDVIQFAVQMEDNLPFGRSAVTYVVATVTPKLITLTTPFSQIDTNNVGTKQIGTNANAGTKGNIGTQLQDKPTGAFLVNPSPAAPPSNTILSGALGQFVDPGNAGPPPNPPLVPATMTPAVTVGGPVPFLSGLFTQTLQLALSGVPVVPQPIAFI